MKRSCRLAAGALAVALALSACGSDTPAPAEDSPAPATQDAANEDPTPDDDEHADHSADEHDAHADHRGSHGSEEDPWPVAVNVLGSSTGEFAPVEGAHGTNGLTIEGTATLGKSESGTTVSMRADGLLPGQSYPAHLHDGSCTDVGGHYMHDLGGPAAPPNEIWASSTGDPAGDLEINHQGTVSGEGSAAWIARQQPLSLMIHASEFPGLPIVCADFAAYEAQVTLVLEADTVHGVDVETIEYSLDGGEMLAYEEAIDISEPGEHTVVVHGIDAGGERGEPREVAFTIVGRPE